MSKAKGAWKRTPTQYRSWPQDLTDAGERGGVFGKAGKAGSGVLLTRGRQRRGGGGWAST